MKKLTPRKNAATGFAPDSWEMARVEAVSVSKTYKSERPCPRHGESPIRYTVNGGCQECAARQKTPLQDPAYTLPGRSRGNRTKGEARRGNRSGRKGCYPEFTVTHLAAIRISDAHYAKAIYLGRGNASKGIRVALDQAALSMPADAPWTRYEAEDFVRRKKTEAKLAAAATRRADWDDT